MPKENFAVGGLDANPLVAPDISAAIADAANPVATKRVPAFHRILPDVFPWNRPQAETQGADFHSRAAEEVLEPRPDLNSDHSEQQGKNGRRDADGRSRDHDSGYRLRQQQSNEQQAPGSRAMRLFRDDSREGQTGAAFCAQKNRK